MVLLQPAGVNIAHFEPVSDNAKTVFTEYR